MDDATKRNVESYNSVARWWRDFGENGPQRKLIEIPAMRALTGNLTGKVVLALGCGTGQELEWLDAQGARRLVGVDGALQQLRLARERIGRRAALVCADIEEIGQWMPEGQFDLVLCSLLLHHMSSLEATLASIGSLLRNCGRVILSLPDPSMFGAENDEAWTRNELGWRTREGRLMVMGDCLTEREVITGLGSHGEELRLHQRSVAQVLTAVLDAGLTITAVQQPRPPEPVPDDGPELRDFKEQWRRLPAFLIVEATQRPWLEPASWRGCE